MSTPIARSANNIILGVVDSSIDVLRALLPGQSQTMAYGGGAGAAPGSALFAVPTQAVRRTRFCVVPDLASVSSAATHDS